PRGLNALEHESIALDMSTSYSTFQSPKTYQSQTLSTTVSTTALQPSPPPNPIKTSFTPIVQPRELPRQRLPESFNLVTPLQGSFSLHTDPSVSLYRARMDNRNVVLRVLNDSADATERHNFLGFASFLAQLGPHPFLPELLGVVSIRAPLVMVVEELENRDLLSYLWQCRQHDVLLFGIRFLNGLNTRTSVRTKTTVPRPRQFLHSKDLLHGNIQARSVLVTKQLTAKLWGLHGVYTRKTKKATQRDDPSMKKWQAPELLARKAATKSSDIYTLIKSCCQWKEQDRPSLAEVSRKLVSGENSASDKVFKASGAVNLEEYLQEAGYGETNNYTVF
ncbi:hypothetical protein GOODEAATRI_004167, partial [Goodea atripinnis]